MISRPGAGGLKLSIVDKCPIPIMISRPGVVGLKLLVVDKCPMLIMIPRPGFGWAEIVSITTSCITNNDP